MKMKISKRASRISPSKRKTQILKAAVSLSKSLGYKSITRDAVAKKAGIASSLIAFYFPKMTDLKNAVLETAIEKSILEIIAQALSVNDETALKLSSTVKNKVASYLSKLP